MFAYSKAVLFRIAKLVSETDYNDFEERVGTNPDSDLDYRNTFRDGKQMRRIAASHCYIFPYLGEPPEHRIRRE